MKLQEFVKLTDFNKYHFIIGTERINRKNKLLSYTPDYDCLMYDADNGIPIIFDESNIETTKLGYKYYKLNKCVYIPSNMRNADNISFWLDKSKLFKVEKIEHENNICWIHLAFKN